jgi:probable phosphoglycerate mutase
METATVVLVRHGETEWNREGRIQGWAPVDLNDRGRDQARRTGAALASEYDVDRIVASDLDRTRETARLLRRALGLDHDAVSFEAGWRERDFGVYQGFDYRALFEGFPQFAVDPSGAAAAREVPEGGESMLTARDRTLDAWGRLRRSLAPGETVLVVTHGGPLYLLLAHLRGQDVVTAIADHHQDNCGINELEVEVVPADAGGDDATAGGDDTAGDDTAAEDTAGGGDTTAEDTRSTATGPPAAGGTDPGDPHAWSREGVIVHTENRTVDPE